MYKFSLTFKDELHLTTEDYFSLPSETKHKNLTDATAIKSSEIEELKEYFSVEEQEAIRKEQEYLLHGPGKIQRILNDEMERLQSYMENKIKDQDEEFLTKMGVKK